MTTPKRRPRDPQARIAKTLAKASRRPLNVPDMLIEYFRKPRGDTKDKPPPAFELPQFPPQMRAHISRTPQPGKALAMDAMGGLPTDPNYLGSSDPYGFAWANDWFAREGLRFLGFPLLSEMAQRPEYRRMAETISRHMTRKWIKIQSKGGNDEEKEENPKGMNPAQMKTPEIIKPDEGGGAGREPAATDAEPPSSGGKVVRLPKVDVDPEGKPAIAMMQPPHSQPDPAKAQAKKDKQEKIKKLEEFMNIGLKLPKVFKEASEMASYFGRAHLYLEFGEDTSDKREELETDVGDGANKASRLKCTPNKPLTRVRCVEPLWVYPQDFNVTDPLAGNWYKPAQWMVMGKNVHASRLLTIVPRPVPDMMKPAYAFGGLPLTQMAKPYVDNWLNVREAVTKIVQSYSIFVLKTGMIEQMDIDGEKLRKRLTLFNAMRDNSGVLAIDKENEDFTNISAPISGLDKLQAQSQEHMAAVSGIPITELLGMQPAGLNASSEGEIETFYDWIHSSQENDWREPLTTIFNFSQLSLFGEIDPELTFDFEMLRTPDALEAAQIAKSKADTDSVYVSAGVISVEEVRQKVANDPDSGYANLDLDLAPPPPQPTELGFGNQPAPGMPQTGKEDDTPPRQASRKNPEPEDQAKKAPTYFTGHASSRIARDAYPPGFFPRAEAQDALERVGHLMQAGWRYAAAVEIAQDSEAWAIVMDWEEAQHPRHGKGTKEGGQFAKKGEGGSGTPSEGSQGGEGREEGQGQPAASGAPAQGHHVALKRDVPEQPTMQLSWEAAPGKTTEHLPEFHDAPLAVRREFQDAIAKVITGPNGEDLIAERMGLKGSSSFAAVGVYQGSVAPGAQTRVPGEIDEETEKLVNAEEAVRAMLLRQDAFAWHKPTFAAGGRQPYLVPALRDQDGTVYVAGQRSAGNTHRNALQMMPPDKQVDYIKNNRHQDDSNFVFINDKGQQLSRTQARKYAEENGLLREGVFNQPKLIAEDLKPEATSRAVRMKPEETNMLDFRIGRKITEDEALALADAMGKVNPFYAPIATEQGFRVLNIPEVTEVDNVKFRQAMVEALEGMSHDTLPEEIEMRAARAQSGYHENNWKEAPNGESYREAIGSAGPDVQRRADEIIAEFGPKIAKVEDEFEQRYGWTPDRRTRFWEQRERQAAE